MASQTASNYSSNQSISSNNSVNGQVLKQKKMNNKNRSKFLEQNLKNNSISIKKLRAWNQPTDLIYSRMIFLNYTDIFAFIFTDLLLCFKTLFINKIGKWIDKTQSNQIIFKIYRYFNKLNPLLKIQKKNEFYSK